MNIPFMDLHRQYQSIKPEIDQAFERTMSRCSFIGGSDKDLFEKEFAESIGAKFCIGVGNGTDSLMLIMKAMGLGAGDEVVVPANTFIATSEMVTACGAKPIFCDIEESTNLMDLDHIERILLQKASGGKNPVKAILPVHLYGRIMDMKKVMALAEKYNLFVIEDCAQAHRAVIDGKMAGTWGHAGSFSFYPGKNLGAFGDAGAIVTNDAALAERMRKLANHGRIGKYDHDMEGYNSRLDGMQAAFLRVKLPHLPEWTRKRQVLAERYYRLLKDIPNVKTLAQPSQATEHVYHLFVVRVQNRSAIQSFMKEKKGIETGVHYPTSLPFLKAYSFMGHTPKDFPVSYQLQSEIMSLPLFPELTFEEQDYIVSALREAAALS